MGCWRSVTGSLPVRSDQQQRSVIGALWRASVWMTSIQVDTVSPSTTHPPTTPLGTVFTGRHWSLFDCLSAVAAPTCSLIKNDHQSPLRPDDASRLKSESHQINFNTSMCTFSFYTSYFLRSRLPVSLGFFMFFHKVKLFKNKTGVQRQLL